MSWMFLCLFFRCCIQFERGKEVKINCGGFPLRGLYKVKALFHSLGSVVERRFPWKSVWRTQALLRAAFFVWLAGLDKILTLDNLRKRQVTVINKCCMCKGARRWWIISFYIVRLPLPCGMPCLVALG
jgi:hypothetical protein